MELDQELLWVFSLAESVVEWVTDYNARREVGDWSSFASISLLYAFVFDFSLIPATTKALAWASCC
jgi:hypothetical protein